MLNPAQKTIQRTWNKEVLFCTVASGLALCIAVGAAYLLNPQLAPQVPQTKLAISHCTVDGAVEILGARGTWNCITTR